MSLNTIERIFGRIRSGPKRNVESIRPGLTHSLDIDKEGLAMNATHISSGFVSTEECITWRGARRVYQHAASESLTLEGFEPAPYSWIFPACGNELCVQPDHLRVYAPVRLEYPRGLCIYCGRTCASRDHLMPRTWTGDAVRRFTAIVPACGTCNSLLRDTLTWSITERRAICRVRLRKHFARVLRTVDHTLDELEEYGPTLRSYIENAISAKREVERMLSWPTDPHYDLRAFERSGIENPYMVGILMDEDELDMEAVHAIADIRRK